MGAVASRRRALRSEAMSSVAAKVRAARAFGEYLSQSHPENRNGADHLLADAYSGHDGSPEMQPAPQNKRRLSLISNGRYEDSLPEEAVSGKPAGEGPQPRVYTISGEPALLPGPEAEAIELAVVKGRQQRERHPRHHSQPLRTSPGGSREDVSRPCQSWAGSRQGSRECPGCAQLAPSPSPQAFGLDQPPLPEAASRRKKLERMYSVDRVSDDIPIRTWFPKENLFSFQTATTTMQANFRKHLRMVGSRRVKAQTFAERRERSFSRSWSDPTPMKADTSHDSRDSSDLQSSHGTLGEAFEDLDWETERGLEAVACDTEGFVPPKVMLISSKVPKAEYIPTILRRDDPSIIPILYDHEHATFEDILEEIEKKLNVYHKGAKIWKMLIFCQGGPGHLYLLKNKVATFAKVEKEEDMIHFWKRLSHLMSKVNPEPNVIHVMGCYVLGNPNGEKLFQNLRTLMTPYRVTFESPLELSAQGASPTPMGLTWKERAFTALLGAAAVSGLTTLILFLVEATNVLLPADTKFGIVFDAGSSHTSLFVYQWLANKENDTGVVSQALACRAKGPGISSYASDPAQAGESLQGCLEEALALIPKAKRQQTPMFLGATGGMRLLSQKNSSQAEDVFAAVSQALSRSPVAFWGAELLAGQDEGALGWVTINYVLGLLVQVPQTAPGREGRPGGVIVAGPRVGGALGGVIAAPGLSAPCLWSVLLLRRMDPASGGDVGGRPGHGWGLHPDHLCAWGPHPGHHRPGHLPPLWHRTQRLHPQLPLLRARPDAEPAPGRAGAGGLLCGRGAGHPARRVLRGAPTLPAEQPEPPGASPLLPQRLPGHAGPGPPVRVALRPGRSPPRPRPEPHCGGDGEPRGLCRRHPGSLQLLQLRRPRRLRLRQRLPAPRAGTVLRLLQLLPHLPLPEPHLQAAAGHGQCHHLGVLPEALEAGGGELARAGRPAARLLCLGPVHPHTPARGLRVQPGDLGRHRVPRAGRWHRHRLDAGLHAEPDQPDPSRGARPVAGTELWRLGGRSRLFGADPHGHSRGHCGAALAPGLGWLPPGAGRQRPELAGAFLSPDPQGSPCGLWPRGHMAPFCHWGHSGHRGCTVAPTMAFRCRRPSRFPMLHEGWAIATPAALRAV
uniref:NMDA receptor synaptonuclear signaling and neuronal migration factor isoform X2 n=1 Tax=Tursiops truncatus TaxID=9739 RepID=A0A6J3RK92_TURTR|nr:NMDA receptor synaptonuclear signaling and neuronal migration factor isoform X2 [Tursiops truncatus]